MKNQNSVHLWKRLSRVIMPGARAVSPESSPFVTGLTAPRAWRQWSLRLPKRNKLPGVPAQRRRLRLSVTDLISKLDSKKLEVRSKKWKMKSEKDKIKRKKVIKKLFKLFNKLDCLYSSLILFKKISQKLILKFCLSLFPVDFPLLTSHFLLYPKNLSPAAQFDPGTSSITKYVWSLALPATLSNVSENCLAISSFCSLVNVPTSFRFMYGMLNPLY